MAYLKKWTKFQIHFHHDARRIILGSQENLSVNRSQKNEKCLCVKNIFKIFLRTMKCFHGC